jgi:hypothetical protein
MSTFQKIKSFLSAKMRDNDLKLFGMAEEIWKKKLSQTSDDWQQLCLLVNTPGKVRRENVTEYFNYVYCFLSRCLEIIKKFPKDTMERMLAFKMIQEHIYTIYHDQIKGYSVWKISKKDTTFIFTIKIPDDKIGLLIGRRGSNIQRLREYNPNVQIFLKNSNGQLNVSCVSLNDILKCAHEINCIIDNKGLLIRTILNRQKWISGILFEISVKYNEVSPISGYPFWLTHITGIGDLITENDEVYELKMSEYKAIDELSTGKYTGVAFLKNNHHAFRMNINTSENITKRFLTQKQQTQIISNTVDMLNDTQDGFQKYFNNENYFRY